MSIMHRQTYCLQVLTKHSIDRHKMIKAETTVIKKNYMILYHGHESDKHESGKGLYFKTYYRLFIRF
jgi:hypothetical protein